jgi:hypothetical protein
LIKGTVPRDFGFSFFNESSSPKPLKITLGSCQFILKILGDLQVKVHHRQRQIYRVSPYQLHQCSGIYATPAAISATSTADVVDTGGKFETSVNDPVANLQPVSTTPVEKLPPLSKTLAANNGSNIRLLTP